MKKIFLSGIILLLLILITVDVYNDHKRVVNQETSNAQAAASATENTEAAPVADANNISNADNNDDLASSAKTSKSTTLSLRRLHNRRAINPGSGDGASGISNEEGDYESEEDPDGLAIITGDARVPSVAAQTPKEFTGNMPAKPRGMMDEKRKIAHFGAEVGIMQNSFYNNNSPKMDQVGFKAGVISDIALSSHIALQPGLLFERKGIEVENNTTTATMNVDTKDKIRLDYLEVPVNFVVKFGDLHDARFVVGAGPYVSYLLAANDDYQSTTTTFGDANPAARTTAVSPYTVTDHVTTEQGNRNLPIGNSSNGAGSERTFDYGVNGFIGVETPGGVSVKAGTEVGLRNMQQNADGSYSSRNYNYFVSIGYLVGFRK